MLLLFAIRLVSFSAYYMYPYLYNLKTRTLVLLMSGRSDVLVAAEQDKYRPKILQVLKEIAPEVNLELILQQLSRMETDGLVDCIVELARKYRELEDENENYRKRKDAFVTLYQKEQDRVREIETKLAEVEKEMNEMRVKHRSELDQIRQEYLNEKDKQFKFDESEDFGREVNGEEIQFNQRYRVGREKMTATEQPKGNTKDEKHASGQISYLPRSDECITPKPRNTYIFKGNS